MPRADQADRQDCARRGTRATQRRRNGLRPLAYHEHPVVQRAIRAGTEPIDVQATRQRGGIQLHGMPPGRLALIHERCHPLPQGVEHLQGHRRGLWDHVPSRGFSSDRIQLALRQREWRRPRRYGDVVQRVILEAKILGPLSVGAFTTALTGNGEAGSPLASDAFR